MTPILFAYRVLTSALVPLTGPYLRARARRGKEDAARLDERFGRATIPRPDGALFWIHAASVGEALMILPLVDALKAHRPHVTVLVTTGTVTSAQMMAQRLPAGAVHQYAPIDRIACVRRFLTHWRPQLAIIAESELWPNLVMETQASGARLALLNARMTRRSLKRWTRAPAAARRLLSAFDWIAAADARTAQGLSALAGRDVPALGNLKFASPPPDVDEDALTRLRELTSQRPVWVAASTHPGEDELVLEAHTLARARGEDWLLVLVPRHPERGPALCALSEEHGFPTARRASGAEPGPDVCVYVADTLGELGLWYRLGRAALVCGSLVDGVGGHNPLEPAWLRAPILAGPYTENFDALYDELFAGGGATRVSNPAQIAEALLRLDETRRSLCTRAAHDIAAKGDSVLESIMKGLRPLTPEAADERA